MDWVKEILNILATLVAISGLLSIPKLFSELSFIRKIDYDEWEKFKQRAKEFDENTQLFEKEALLRTVGFLKNFTWNEFEFVMSGNLNLSEIKKINILMGRGIIKFDLKDKEFYLSFKNKLLKYIYFIKFDGIFVIFCALFSFSYLFYNVSNGNILLNFFIIIFISFYLFFIFTVLNLGFNFKIYDIERELRSINKKCRESNFA